MISSRPVQPGWTGPGRLDGLQPAPLLAPSNLSNLSNLFSPLTRARGRARTRAYVRTCIGWTGWTGRTDTVTARVVARPTCPPGWTESAEVGRA